MYRPHAQGHSRHCPQQCGRHHGAKRRTGLTAPHIVIGILVRKAVRIRAPRNRHIAVKLLLPSVCLCGTNGTCSESCELPAHCDSGSEWVPKKTKAAPRQMPVTRPLSIKSASNCRNDAGLASDFLSHRQIRTELHRPVRNFLAARPQSNRGENSRNNDSALHCLIS